VRDRTQRGLHTTLAGVSQSTGITVLALERICRSLLSGAVARKPKLPSAAVPPAMLYSPVISTELCQVSAACRSRHHVIALCAHTRAREDFHCFPPFSPFFFGFCCILISIAFEGSTMCSHEGG